MRPTVLIAASGLAREAVEAIRACGDPPPVAVLDDDPARWGELVAGVPVTGGVDTITDHPGAAVLLCPGRGAARAALAARLAGRGIGEDRYATVVHPGAVVPPSCRVGPGSIVLAGVVLTVDVRVGRHVVLMPRVVLTHDDVVADHATLAAGVALGGWVSVGEAAYLGMNAGVRERVTIGAGATIGMGAVVVQDVPADQTWAGVPARPLRPAPPAARALPDLIPTGGTLS